MIHRNYEEFYIATMKKLKNSHVGNPQWLLTLISNSDDYILNKIKTPANHGWVYAMSHHWEHKNVGVEYHITPTGLYKIDSMLLLKGQ